MSKSGISPEPIYVIFWERENGKVTKSGNFAMPTLEKEVVSTLIFARVAAVLANKAPAKLLNQATGVILVILGTAIIAVQYVF